MPQQEPFLLLRVSVLPKEGPERPRRWLFRAASPSTCAGAQAPAERGPRATPCPTGSDTPSCGSSHAYSTVIGRKSEKLIYVSDATSGIRQGRRLLMDRASIAAGRRGRCDALAVLPSGRTTANRDVDSGCGCGPQASGGTRKSPAGMTADRLGSGPSPPNSTADHAKRSTGKPQPSVSLSSWPQPVDHMCCADPWNSPTRLGRTAVGQAGLAATAVRTSPRRSYIVWPGQSVASQSRWPLMAFTSFVTPLTGFT
jgi:hypothetical protein